MRTRMNEKIRRFSAVFLALVMVFSVINITPQPVYAAEADVSSEAFCYGLKDNVQDGVILHCWDWSFSNIKEQMELIAASGYSAIQTSPIQEAKEPTAGVSNDNWWVLYQPKSFTIDNSGNSGLGTKAEFEAMCDEAHKYGIKVIVDIVANHTGNDGNGGIASTVISDIKDDPDCYHKYYDIHDIDYNDRNSITHDSMGLLPDLNTENTKVQNYVISLLKECIDSGADGFRFDAAKHISVPNEGSEYTFWPNVIDAANLYAKSTRGITLYNYGEILGDTGGPDMSDYTQYMSVTDNQTSNELREFIVNGNASGAAASAYKKGVAANKLVLWAESHDTYSNDSRESTNVSIQDIKKTWAIAGSRANATALYYVRTEGWRTGTIGDIGSMDWSSTEVAEINKFHNYFAGEKEYLASSGNIVYNERGTSGVVLVNCSGTSASVSVLANKLSSGTYTDQITGNTFTVSNGRITGQIGNSGIAVVYNNTPKAPQPTISQEGGTFKTEVLSLTVGLSNATSGTYQIGDGSVITYTGSETITIGSDMDYNESVTITLSATGETTTNTVVYTFTKLDPSQAGNIAYLSLPSGWSEPVYCYVYDSVNEDITEGAWPGNVMSFDSETGYYKYEVSEKIENPKVIFFSSDENRYPADMEPGLDCNGKYLYKDGSWAPYITLDEGKVVVEYVDDSGTSIAESKTMTGKIGEKYTTSADTIDGYELIEIPANANGTYTASTITVTYVYAKKSSETLSVTAKADATEVVTGGKVTFTATATGGSGSYSYSYIVYNKTTGKWARIKDKIASDTYTWKAGSVGTRIFYVDVTDSDGKTVRSEAITVITKEVNAILTAISKASVTTTEVGDKVTFTATATGGSGSYKYSYIVYNETTGKWSRIKDKIESNTYTWKAVSAGTRLFYVDVTDSNDVTIRCDAIKVVTKEQNPLTVTGSAADLNLLVGETTSIIGLAEGGTGSYTYSFVVYNTVTKGWYRYGFNVSNVKEWKAISAGTRKFYVEVKDSDGNVVRSEAVTIIVE